MASTLKTFFTRLFGAHDVTSQSDSSKDAVEYKGYLITPSPYAVQGQYQTAGVITKDFESGPREHRFVRAETHPRMQDAASFSVSKGMQIIDEQGDRIFD